MTEQPKEDKNQAAVSLGSLGGKATAAKMTPEQRSERAKNAGLMKGKKK